MCGGVYMTCVIGHMIGGIGGGIVTLTQGMLEDDIHDIE